MDEGPFCLLAVWHDGKRGLSLRVLRGIDVGHLRASFMKYIRVLSQNDDNLGFLSVVLKNKMLTNLHGFNEIRILE